MVFAHAGDKIKGTAQQEPPTIIVVITMKIVSDLHQNNRDAQFNFRHTHDGDQFDPHRNGGR